MNKEKRKLIYNKFGGRCAYCGKLINYKEMQVDHIIPKSRFHIHRGKVPYKACDIKNLNPSCASCNLWKHNFSIEVFRAEIEAQIARIRERSASFRLMERYGIIEVVKPKIKFYFEENPCELNSHQK